MFIILTFRNNLSETIICILLYFLHIFISLHVFNNPNRIYIPPNTNDYLYFYLVMITSLTEFILLYYSKYF